MHNVNAPLDSLIDTFLSLSVGAGMLCSWDSLFITVSSLNTQLADAKLAPV